LRWFSLTNDSKTNSSELKWYDRHRASWFIWEQTNCLLRFINVFFDKNNCKLFDATKVAFWLRSINLKLQICLKNLTNKCPKKIWFRSMLCADVIR